MRTLRLVLILVVMVTGTGWSASPEPTRALAAKIISASPPFAETISFFIAPIEHCYVRGVTPAENSPERREQQWKEDLQNEQLIANTSSTRKLDLQSGAQILSAQRHGLLDITREYFNIYGAGVPPICKSTWQAVRRGIEWNVRHAELFHLVHWRATVSKKAIDAGIPAEGVTAKLFQRQLVEITGITKERENVVTVEFDWEWVPIDTGKRLGLASSGRRKGRDHLRQYDDGWRLMR